MDKPIEDSEVISLALAIVAKRFTPGTDLTSPQKVRELLALKHADLENEHFSVLYLDSRNRLIKFVTLFTGTVDGASVYPREVLKVGLTVNASALILTHNHPSGDPEPSEADKRITRRIKDILEVVDIRLLDHIITGGARALSMAERGLI